MPASRAIWTGPWPWPYAPGLAPEIMEFQPLFDLFANSKIFFPRILGVPIFGQVTSVKIFEGGGDALESACCRLEEMVPSKGNQA